VLSNGQDKKKKKAFQETPNQTERGNTYMSIEEAVTVNGYHLLTEFEAVMGNESEIQLM